MFSAKSSAWKSLRISCRDGRPEETLQISNRTPQGELADPSLRLRFSTRSPFYSSSEIGSPIEFRFNNERCQQSDQTPLRNRPCPLFPLPFLPGTPRSRLVRLPRPRRSLALRQFVQQLHLRQPFLFLPHDIRQESCDGTTTCHRAHRPCVVQSLLNTVLPASSSANTGS
jgi:hypothetical protein